MELVAELVNAPIPLPGRLVRELETAGPIKVAGLICQGAREWPAPVIQELRELAERNGYIAAWVSQLKSPVPTERIAAIEVLTLLRVESAVPLLVDLLCDRVEDVRWTAAAGLESFRDPSVIKPLIELLAEPARTTPARVANILVAMGQMAITPLLEALPGLSPVSRSLVVEILGQMKSPQVVPGLTAVLESPDPVLRAKAAEALGENGDLLALEPLLRALHDPVEAVRVRAARALGQLGSPRAVEALTRAQQDPSWRVQSGAAEALAAIQRFGASSR